MNKLINTVVILLVACGMAMAIDQKIFTSADKTKLDNIEPNATQDMTGSEIKAAYQAEPNAFTDALYSKLGGIESGATADMTGAEIKTAYQAEPNAFTDAQFSKLAGIEAGADYSDPNLENGSVTNLHLHSKLAASDGDPADAVQTDVSGNVGIGTASPAYQFQVTGTATAGSGVICIERPGINSPVFRTRSSGGTISAPTKTVSGAELIKVACQGYQETTGAYTVDASSITCTATEDFTSTAQGTAINFYTTPNGTATSTQKVIINNAGNVGIGTTSPGTILELAKSASGDIGPTIKLRNTAGGAGDQSTIDFATYTATDLSETRGRIASYVRAGGQGRLDFFTKAGATSFSATPDMSISAGNVGIGTTSPIGKLHVQQATPDYTEVAAIFGDSADQKNVYIIGNTINQGYNRDDDVTGLFVNYKGYQGGTTRYRDFYVADGKSGTVAFFDGSSGNVGIGTASPSQQLEITGDFEIPNTTYADQSGIIYKGADRFIHDFNYGNNGSVTTEGHNIFIGKNAGNFTMGSTASQTYHSSANIGFGENTLDALTIGFDNTAFGYGVLTNATEGYYNTGIGRSALAALTTGSGNFGLGFNSLSGVTTGTYLTGLGYMSGAFLANGMTTLSTGSYGLYIGAYSKASANGVTNETAIGSAATGQGSNTIMLGNSSVTGLYCYDTSISSPSDARIKENVQTIDPDIALAFIADLRPVTYHKKNPATWEDKIKPSQFKDRLVTEKVEETVEVLVDPNTLQDIPVIEEIISLPIEGEEKPAKKPLTLAESKVLEDGMFTKENGQIYKTEKIVKDVEKLILADPTPETNTAEYLGLIAQEVQASMEKFNIQSELVPVTPNGMLAVRYTDMIPMLIASIQRLTGRVETLEAEKVSQNARINDLVLQVEGLATIVAALQASDKPLVEDAEPIVQ